jgi:hypothetical protein
VALGEALIALAYADDVAAVSFSPEACNGILIPWSLGCANGVWQRTRSRARP